MKKMRLLIGGLLCFGMVGFATYVGYSPACTAAEVAGSHEGVMEPTKELMGKAAKHLNNILDGILSGNFKYVAQEAGAIVDQSYKINEAFFPVDPKENRWFQRAKINPKDSERIEKLKEEFSFYIKGLASSALEIQKAAKSNNEETAFKSFAAMVEKTCFECHRNVRDKQIPIENR